MEIFLSGKGLGIFQVTFGAFLPQFKVLLETAA